MNVGRLIFLLSRLRQATLRELAHRGREQVCWKVLIKCPWLFYWLVRIPPISVENTKRIHFFRIYPSLGREASSFSEDYVTELAKSEGEDIRILWEPARLQRITDLLQEQTEGRASTFQDAEKMLFQWLRDNPFLSYPHYLSVMECGLRLPVLLFALKRLKLSDEQCLQLHKSIFEHAWLIRQRLSLYSSLGNHTIAESVGLVLAGTIFASHSKGREWFSKGLLLLDQELPHQIVRDGGPAEQSLSYHRFVLDLYWLIVDFLELNGFRDCSDWCIRLKAGELFLAAFTDECGFFPTIGDNDNGYAIGAGLTPKRFVPESCRFGIKTFPDSGYTICRLGTGLHLTIDHGPLGMAPLYNHGHADALSFTLRVHGVSFFVDPGTYRYNGVPKHRQYFKGTRAHNTVSIDGMDQARQLTSFIWDKPYEAGAKILTRNGAYEIDAWHDGYQRLPMPVTHRRVFHVEEDTIRVCDFFQGKGVHDFDLHLHLHPEVKSNFCGDVLELERDGLALTLHINGSGKLDLVTGQEEPLLGWYSPAYGEIMPTTVVRFRQRGEPADVRFETCIQLKVV